MGKIMVAHKTINRRGKRRAKQLALWRVPTTVYHATAQSIRHMPQQTLGVIGHYLGRNEGDTKVKQQASQETNLSDRPWS